MLVFLPISRFIVPYEVAKGRSYSAFEKLLMECLRDAPQSVDALHDTFLIHRRVIIEAIVTLMQAGWVTMDAKPGQFGLTAAGEFALNHSDLPPSIETKTKTASIILERVSGQVCSSRDVAQPVEMQRNNTFPRENTVVDDARLKPVMKIDEMEQLGIVLRPSPQIPNVLIEGQVLKMLPCEPEEWIRYVSESRISRDGRDFLVVEVDDATLGDNIAIRGIPDGWKLYLEDSLQEAAESWRNSGRKVANQVGDQRPTGPTQASVLQASERFDQGVDSTEFLVGMPAHRLQLLKSLNAAKRFLFLHSVSISEDTVTELETHIRNALRRGVIITVLIGTGLSSLTRGDQHAALNRLRAISSEAKTQGYSGSLYLTGKPTNSYFNLLLTDLPEETNENSPYPAEVSNPPGEAYFGSHSWLGCSADCAGIGSSKTIESHIGPLSLRIIHPYPLMRFTIVLSNLCKRDSSLQTSSATNVLENLRNIWSRRDSILRGEAANARTPDRFGDGNDAGQNDAGDLLETHLDNKQVSSIDEGYFRNDTMSVEALLLFDRGILTEFNLRLGKAQNRVSISSSHWNLAAHSKDGNVLRVRNTLLGALPSKQISPLLWYGTSVTQKGDDGSDASFGDFMKLGIDTEQRPVCVNLLLVDDDYVAISSLPWLNPQIYKTPSTLAEEQHIALILRGPGLPDTIADMMEILH